MEVPQEAIPKTVTFFPKHIRFLESIDNNLSNATRMVVDRQMSKSRIREYNQPMMLIAFGMVFFALAIIILLPSVLLSAILFLCVGFAFVGLSVGILAMEKRKR